MKSTTKIGSMLFVFIFMAMFIIGTGGTTSKADPMRAPKAATVGRGPTIEKSANALPLRKAVRFFRTTISPVDGNRCPMYPTCSQYGEEAVERHGPLLGLMLIIDRLFHEWSETARAPQVWVHGVSRYWDPLESNDFWLSGHRSPKDTRDMGSP